MSELSEKLAKPEHAQGNKARASRRQLFSRSGLVTNYGDHIEIWSMGKQEIWRWSSGTGDSAVFEKEN